MRKDHYCVLYIHKSTRQRFAYETASLVRSLMYRDDLATVLNLHLIVQRFLEKLYSVCTVFFKFSMCM